MTAAAESAEVKAQRLLAEGRVLLEAVDPARVAAVVAGDHGVYAVAIGGGGASCSCAELQGRCSHIAAVRLVTGR